MSLESFLEGVCKPLLVYGAVMAALVTYNITQKDIKSVGKNTLFLAIGGIAIFLLCSSGFEAVAWVLLMIPPFFFVAILALLVITQVFKTKATYEDGSSVGITGDSVRKILGFRLSSPPDSYVNGNLDRLVGKPYNDVCSPPAAAAETCNQCDTCA